MSGRVSVPCWHATPVANAPWKPLIIGGGQAQYQCHEIGGKSDWLGSHCWSRIRMSFNIRERDTSYCWIRSPYRPYNFLNDDFKRSARYPCLSSLLESRLARLYISCLSNWTICRFDSGHITVHTFYSVAFNICKFNIVYQIGQSFDFTMIGNHSCRRFYP